MSRGRMLVVVVNAIILASRTIRGEVDVGVVNIICGRQDVPDSEDKSMMDYVAYDLVHHTAQEGFNHYAKNELGYMNVYGRGVCLLGILVMDFTTCLSVGDFHRIGNCKFTLGSRIMSKSCYLRVEEYDFTYDPKEKTITP